MFRGFFCTVFCTVQLIQTRETVSGYNGLLLFLGFSCLKVKYLLIQLHGCPISPVVSHILEVFCNRLKTKQSLFFVGVAAGKEIPIFPPPTARIPSAFPPNHPPPVAAGTDRCPLPRLLQRLGTSSPCVCVYVCKCVCLYVHVRMRSCTCAHAQALLCLCLCRLLGA